MTLRRMHSGRGGMIAEGGDREIMVVLCRAGPRRSRCYPIKAVEPSHWGLHAFLRPTCECPSPAVGRLRLAPETAGPI
jgi:hypothetical protein